MPLLSDKELIDDRDYLNRRMSEMDQEYSSFRDHYKELSEFFDPRRGRFFLEDRNRGAKRHKNIINNKGTKALRRATAGMLAGAMSPSRPWFAWDMMDKALLQDSEVKYWLELFRRVILLVFAKSNFYNMAPLMLRELLLFGTGAMTHEDDFDDVARFYTHTAGSYMIATNSRGVVDTLARRFQMTCYQMVKKFGLENVSIAVKNNWDRGNYGAWHTVNHFVELNPFRDEDSARFSSEFQRFRSVYWENKINKGTDQAKYLKRSGTLGFPCYAPRWELADGDVYAVNCPGMTALGDTKQLQTQEREMGKALAKHVTPPLQGPPSMRNKPIHNLPGGMTVNTSTNHKIESLYSLDPRIQEMAFDIQRTEKRIDDAMHIDLFMAITEMEGIQPKNQLQLSQINEERLLQLGPVLEQVHGEWLARAVGRVAQQVLDAGIMPPAPEKLEGKQLEAEFVSALAMAQRSVATGAIERTVSFAVGLLEAGWEGAIDKIDPDFAVDEYSSLVGSPSRLVVPSEVAQQVRQERYKAQQQQAQLEQAATAAQAINQVGNANLQAMTGQGR